MRCWHCAGKTQRVAPKHLGSPVALWFWQIHNGPTWSSTDVISCCLYQTSKLPANYGIIWNDTVKPMFTRLLIVKKHLATFLDLMPNGAAGPALECLFEIVAFQPWPHILTYSFIHFQICVWIFRLTELAVNWTIFALENAANAACSILQGFKDVFEWFCRHHKVSNSEAWAQLPHCGERW